MTDELKVPSGVLRVNRFGDPGGRLTICVHGLSANSRSFDFLAQSMASSERAVVCVDLRGRGWSEITPAGTYGWGNHAKDVLDVATALGRETFDYVGHSMGAFIGMDLAKRAPERVQKLALIDAIGVPETGAMPSIFAAVQRLGAVYPSADAYLAALKKLGTVDPWNRYWDAHYRYDLVPSKEGVVARTDKTAVMEDVAYASLQQPRSYWPSITMETLLLRASRLLGSGFIVSEDDRKRFVTTAPRARSVDIDANHYGIMMHPSTAQHLGEFLK
jgi:pimeloyl-ACP methyl ester carboxylesterase